MGAGLAQAQKVERESHAAFRSGGNAVVLNGPDGKGATKLMAMADAKTKIVPGHGPLGDKAPFTNYRDMLSAVHDNVQKQKAAGKSLKEVVAAEPTSAFDAGSLRCQRKPATRASGL
jgi:hypothetical protein